MFLCDSVLHLFCFIFLITFIFIITFQPKFFFPSIFEIKLKIGCYRLPTHRHESHEKISLKTSYCRIEILAKRPLRMMPGIRGLTIFFWTNLIFFKVSSFWLSFIICYNYLINVDECAFVYYFASLYMQTIEIISKNYTSVTT